MGSRPAVAGGRARRWRGVRTWVALAAALTLTSACEREPAFVQDGAWLERVETPSGLRYGSPVAVFGSGLAGKVLVLSDPSGHAVEVLIQGAGHEGIFPGSAPGYVGQVRYARVRRHGAGLGSDVLREPWLDGPVAFDQACVDVASGAATLPTCVPVATTWRGETWPQDASGKAPPLLRPWSASGGATVEVPAGGLLEVAGVGVPLPGEGLAWLDTRVTLPGMPGELTATVAVFPWGPAGERRAHVIAAPAWLGPEAGPRQVQVRLRRRRAVAGVPPSDWPTTLSPWAPAVAVRLTTPEVIAPGGVLALRRGEVSALRFSGRWARPWPGGPTPSAPGLTLRLVGAWQTKAGTQTWGASGPSQGSLPFVGPVARAALTSAAWFAGPWPQVGAGTFTGSVQLVLRGGGREVRVPQQGDVDASLAPTVQRITVSWSASTLAGLARFGLSAVAGELLARVREIVASHFVANAVEVRLVRAEMLDGGRCPEPSLTGPASDGAAADEQSGAPACRSEAEALHPATEQVVVALLDRDPNGLNLLGNEPTAGKDVGNTSLDERLDGAVDLAGAAAGNPPYGGVFFAGFFLMSPTLNPGGLLTDPTFDAIFGPFAPALGGVPLQPGAAGDGRTSARSKAVEALAQLLAGTVSHEVGHALGLPAVSGFHHAEDHPGWRMDAGTARPFAERANLAGSGGERWGPIDQAALDAVLPKPAP